MKKLFFALAVALLFLCAPAKLISQTVWNSNPITFTKENHADWWLPENQDRIMEDIWITRANFRPIFNAALENPLGSPQGTMWALGSISDGVENLRFDSWRETVGSKPPSSVGKNMVLYLMEDDIYIDITFTSWVSGEDSQAPSDTEWAFGTIADGVETLDFNPWISTIEGNPPGMVDQNMVLHLITDDIYIDIKFTSWSTGGSGGGFSYERSTGTIGEQFWTGPVTTVTKADNADWTLEENQDRITDNVWLTRADNQGLFNIVNESSYAEARGGGGFSYERTTGTTSEQFWTGPELSFSKASHADWTLPENQDRITDNVILTRADEQGIFNIASENGYNAVRGLIPTLIGSPIDTRWAFGSISDGVESLDFGVWADVVNYTPPDMVGQPMVVYLEKDDIYVDITFTSWTSNNNGGGFSYERSTGTSGEQFWTGPVTTFTKADNADWTQEASQDRITDNVWLTRADNQGLFNIKSEDSYQRTSSTLPTNTLWAFGNTEDGVENLTFDYLLSTTEEEMPVIVGQEMVMLLEPYDIYVDIMFTQWTSGEDNPAPSGTLWAPGSISQGVESLDFYPWKMALEEANLSPPEMVGQPMVLYLQEDSIYIDVAFTSWTSGGSGGGFSYNRSTGDPGDVLWTGATTSFTKADYADWTQEANQDRITDNVWITRADQRGIFNIAVEPNYNYNTGGGGFSYIRATEAGSSNASDADGFVPELICYPNPASDFIYVKRNFEDGSAQFRLIDLEGRIVLSEPLERSNLLNVEHLPEGLYIYRVGGAEKTFTGKLIIR